MTRRLLGLGLPAVAVLATATACVDPGTPAPGSAANAAAAQSGLCLTGDVRATIVTAPVEGTEQTALVTVTNTGNDTCAVNGWLSITLVNAANQPVPVPTVKLDRPGPATEIPLAAGAAAYAGIKWTSCTRGEPDCGVGTGLRYDLAISTTIGPSAQLEGFTRTKRQRINITMQSLEIGSLQPTETGVTDW
jgi:hypothetical protein